MYMRSFIILVTASVVAAANIAVRRQIVISSATPITSVLTSAPLSSPTPTMTHIAFSSAVPVPAVVRIHPGGSNTKCLDVAANVQANGTPVQIYDCNGTGAQNWLIIGGTTQVRLAGTNFCLDAGSTPGNGVEMKIWECFDNLPAQTWFYTSDQRIALKGQGQCLDLPNGNLSLGTHVQTWQCTSNNANQVWTTTA
ncbi:hypothetical protein HGRIS_013248 [Hohenbuehelia grisea]|uniref:Ricin B lectin domain-containing protein n=1 Tax=Hohenbuehelia grisea TaxID=104357 RepID=A0ABR3IV21_9AGAR